MIKKIPFRFAVNFMLAMLSAVLVYHLLIISGIIPYEATWGGRLKTVEDMYRFETVSIIINLATILLIAAGGGYIKSLRPGRVVTVLLWLLVVLYALNTVGNIFSQNLAEAIIFTPLTAISAVLCARMALEPYPAKAL